jgi:hypothetical protein
VTHVSDPLKQIPSCVIVLQGGILKKHDFTFETIKLYKKVYSGVNIILSTWDDEDQHYLKKIESENVTIVLSKKPDFFGESNVNLQLISAGAGIRKAKELGFEYVTKTRTDQRMYNKNIIESMYNLVTYFPPGKNVDQNKRIIFLHGLTKYQPYHFPDMFSFGNVDDMITYWSPPLVKEESDYPFFFPEIYLATEYFKRGGKKLEWSIENIWQIYLRHIG